MKLKGDLKSFYTTCQDYVADKPGITDCSTAMVSATSVPSNAASIKITDGVTLTETMAVHAACTSTYTIVSGGIITPSLKLRDLQ